MKKEEALKYELVKRFAFLEGKVTIPRPRRIYVEAGQDKLEDLIVWAKDVQGFLHLCTITGLDEKDSLGFIYHLAHDSGILLNFRTAVPKSEPRIKSIIKYFPGAEIYERELADLFGAVVEGLPEGNRYPLTDDWPKDEHPLRKDWKPKSA